MRVRLFFWLLLTFSCISVLLLAALVHMHVPAVMQVHLEQQNPVSISFTTIELHITDKQGLPIEEAQISSIARMTNMDMMSDPGRVKYLGQGNYIAQLRLYMAGPWAVTIQADADGFDSLHQQLFLQVE